LTEKRLPAKLLYLPDSAFPAAIVVVDIDYSICREKLSVAVARRPKLRSPARLDDTEDDGATSERILDAGS
jgi:hypothetical protein